MLPQEVDPTSMAKTMIRHLWRVGDRIIAGDLGDKIYEGFFTKSPKLFINKQGSQPIGQTSEAIKLKDSNAKLKEHEKGKRKLNEMVTSVKYKFMSKPCEVCYNCNLLGHIARNCDRPPRKDRCST